MYLRIAAASFVLAALLVAPCRADGIVILDFNRNDTDNVSRLRISPDDSIYVKVNGANGCGFFGFSPDGTLIPTFGDQGRLSTGECVRDFGVRADGSLDMLDATGLHVQFRDPTGALVSTSGRVFPDSAQEGYKAAARALLRLSSGQFMVGGQVGVCIACDPGDLDWAVARLNADGSVDDSFSNGLLRKPSLTALGWLYELPDGKVMGAGLTTAFDQVTELSRFDDAGLDFTYGLNANVSVLVSGPIAPGGIALDSSGRAYAFGPRGDVVRLTTEGTVDATFTAVPANNGLAISNIAVDSMDRILLFGTTNGTGAEAYIARYTSTGAPDATFNGTGSMTFSFPRPIGFVTPGGYGWCAGELQSQDRLVLACRVENLNGIDLALARFTDTGQLDTTFGAVQVDTDLYPDAFSFPDVSVPYGTLNVVSDPVTVTGFDEGRETTASAGVGAAVAINCDGNWVSVGYVRAGETLCVRQNASTSPGGSAVVTVTVGGRQATFTVVSTNTAADSIPDAFEFTPQTNVARDTLVVSDSITIEGITGYSTAVATNGAFSIGCTNSFVTSSTFITNGMTLCVRHTSSSQYATSVTTTLNVGGVSADFTSTTAAAPIEPPAPPSTPPSTGKKGGGGLDELLLGALALCAALSLRRRVRRNFRTR